MSGGFRIPYVAWFGRTYEEYLEMFVLTAEELAGDTTLDCASGPSSFTAGARAAGCAVTACDPSYALDPETLLREGRANLDACFAAIEEQENLTFRDYPAFKRAKYAAVEAFAADLAAAADGRYVPGSLPGLPFAGEAFDRVLCANLLFSYAHHRFGGLYDGEEFDLAFHLAAVEELARVAARELRLSPTGSFDPPPRPHDFRDPVCARLEELGWQVELVPSAFDSGLAGFNDVLVARRPTG